MTRFRARAAEKAFDEIHLPAWIGREALDWPEQCSPLTFIENVIYVSGSFISQNRWSFKISAAIWSLVMMRAKKHQSATSFSCA